MDARLTRNVFLRNLLFYFRLNLNYWNFFADTSDLIFHSAYVIHYANI